MTLIRISKIKLLFFTYFFCPKLFDSFETENKIFAQEAGKVDGKDKSNEGTSNNGWYQYEGDDGKIYRVEYEAGEQGFIPKV